MPTPEYFSTTFPDRTIERAEAEAAGQYAYRHYLQHTVPTLSPYALLSYCVRRQDDPYLLDANRRALLADKGFLRYGETIPLRTRLLLPGIVAVAMVIPEIENGEIIGEHVEEPFKGVSRLAAWYKKLKDAEDRPARISFIEPDIEADIPA